MYQILSILSLQIILMPGLGISSNILFALFIMLSMFAALNMRSISNLFILFILLTIPIVLFSMDQSLSNPIFYGILKIFFVIFFIYSFNINFSRLYKGENRLTAIIIFYIFMAIVNILLYASAGILPLSNEKGIAGYSLLLITLAYFIQRGKVNWYLFIFILFIDIYLQSLRAILLILILLAYNYRSSFKLKHILIFLSFILLTIDFFDQKYGAFMHSFDGSDFTPVGRYAATYLSSLTLAEHPIFGYGFGSYHSVYAEYLPFSPVDGIDYSGFSLAEWYVEIGIISFLLFGALYWWISRSLFLNGFSSALIIFSMASTSPTDKLFYVGLPILIGFLSLLDRSHKKNIKHKIY
jgi:hypothetical protein